MATEEPKRLPIVHLLETEDLVRKHLEKWRTELLLELIGQSKRYVADLVNSKETEYASLKPTATEEYWMAGYLEALDDMRDFLQWTWAGTVRGGPPAEPADPAEPGTVS